MSENELCSRCRAEPRVAGQRWGLLCRANAEAARRARVPCVSRGTVSRRASRGALDAWLKQNAALLEFEAAASVVRRLREAGLYSGKTTNADVRLSYQMRCLALGLSYATGPTARTES